MPIYNKLVRDLIPQIIEDNGEKCIVRLLSEQELILEVKRKFIEEAHEVNAAENREDMKGELADLLELIHTTLETYHISFDLVEVLDA